MKSLIRLTTKQLVLSLAALTMLAAAHSTARADEVVINGFTNGCFGAACTPEASATFIELTFNNSTFSGATAGGFRGIGSNAGLTNFNNLGSLSLSSAARVYNTPFSLLVTFTAPQGIAGSSNATYVATVTGTVGSNNIGGIFVDFDNTPLVFTFNDSNCEDEQTTCGIGSFAFSVNDTSLDPGSTVPLTGQVTAAQQQVAVPEPATLLLLGTGLAGIAARLRKRRQAQTETTETSG